MTQLPPSFPDQRVAVLGMGYVGLTLALVMAEIGFRVFGVEAREDVVQSLRDGIPHFYEKGMAERLPRVVTSGSLTIDSQLPNAASVTTFIITVGTPLNDMGRVELRMIEHASDEVASRLSSGDLVVMRSTVKVGTTRQTVLPILEKADVEFDLAFCPERTLEGQALDELRQLPQIVAGLTHGSAMRAAQLFQLLTPTVVRVSDIETAEMIKMVDNAQRDVSFAYANEVARLCDALGISAAEVIRAGKLGYPRTDLPMPGPVGGPCLSKDPYILAQSVEDVGVEPELAMVARRINERQPKEVVSYLRKVTRRLDDWPAQPVITLLGLAFKGRPPTDDLRGTMAFPVLEELRRVFPSATIRGFDPEVPASIVQSLQLSPTSSLEEAVEGTNLVMILNNHPLFGEMPLEDLAHRFGRPGIIYDFWNNFFAEELSLPPGTGYISLGSHGRGHFPAN